MKKILFIYFITLFCIAGFVFAQESAREKFGASTQGETPADTSGEESEEGLFPTPINVEPQQQPEAKVAPIPVMVFKVKQVPEFKKTIPVLGTIVPFEKTELKFPERGVVKDVYVDVGDKVGTNQLLSELEEKEFILRSEFAKSKHQSEMSMLHSMEKDLFIQKQLFDKGAILKERLEEVELKIESQKFRAESAAKEWELAQESLKRIRLNSPVTGMVEEKEIEKGEFVGPETVAFTILKIDKVYAEVGVTEKDITKIKSNLVANIAVEAYPDEQFKGYVKNIHPSVTGSSRTLTVRIEIPNEAYDYKLLPGMFLRGEIVLRRLIDAYIIPTDVIIEIAPQEHAVYVVQLDKELDEEELGSGDIEGMIVSKKITVVDRGEEFTSIEGLEEGDLVISRVQGKLVPFSKAIIVSVEQYEAETE